MIENIDINEELNNGSTYNEFDVTDLLSLFDTNEADLKVMTSIEKNKHITTVINSIINILFITLFIVGEVVNMSIIGTAILITLFILFNTTILPNYRYHKSL